MGSLHLSLPLNPTCWVMRTWQQSVANLCGWASCRNGFDKHAHLHRSAVATPAITVSVRSVCERKVPQESELGETLEWYLIKGLLRLHAALGLLWLLVGWDAINAAQLMQISQFSFYSFLLSILFQKNLKPRTAESKLLLFFMSSGIMMCCTVLLTLMLNRNWKWWLGHIKLIYSHTIQTFVMFCEDVITQNKLLMWSHATWGHCQFF